MLDAQPDAVRIRFDSQSFSASSPPVVKSKSKLSKKDKVEGKKAKTTTKGKGRPPKSVSPLPEVGRARTQSVVQESEPSPVVEEPMDEEQPEEVDLGFDHGDFGGGGEEDQPIVSEDEEGLVAPARHKSKVRPVVEILVPRHKAKKDKGKQKAPQREDSPIDFDHNHNLPDDPELLLAMLASTRPSQAAATSSQAVAGPSRERAVAGPSRDRPSTSAARASSPPVPAPSRFRGSNAVAGPFKSSQKRRRLPSTDDEDDGFVVQTDESDKELVRKNRSKKRKQPVEDEDDEDDFDSSRKERAEKKKRHRRRSSPVDEGSDDSDSTPQASINPYRQDRNKPGARVNWTDEEERLLMREMARWPNGWAKINERHGEYGTISDGLKNRNPVSLKDKARNIKISLKKAGRKVPSFLNGGQLGAFGRVVDD